MAKVLGESGRNVSDAATQETRKLVHWGCATVSIVGAVEGFFLASLLPRFSMPHWLSAGATLGAAALLIVLSKWGSRKMDEIDRKRMAFRRGADGEYVVGLALARLPDDFHVINDLTTPFGNLDHVVIGPTGVYILDTKSWRGVVTADGRGELILNGQPLDKPHIRRFVARTMSIRDRVRALAPDLDPYFDSVFVFTSAKVEARWGTTGRVNCIRDEQLHDYIVEKSYGKRLRAEHAQTLAQAFLALARMDRDFSEHDVSEPERAAAA